MKGDSAWQVVRDRQSENTGAAGRGEQRRVGRLLSRRRGLSTSRRQNGSRAVFREQRDGNLQLWRRRRMTCRVQDGHHRGSSSRSRVWTNRQIDRQTDNQRQRCADFNAFEASCSLHVQAKDQGAFS